MITLLASVGGSDRGGQPAATQFHRATAHRQQIRISVIVARTQSHGCVGEARRIIRSARAPMNTTSESLCRWLVPLLTKVNQPEAEPVAPKPT